MVRGETTVQPCLGVSHFEQTYRLGAYLSVWFAHKQPPQNDIPYVTLLVNGETNDLLLYSKTCGKMPN